jgi:hypothetical protein
MPPPDAIRPRAVCPQNRCRMLCTCARISTCSLFSSGTDIGDVETVAEVLADLFHSEGVIDVVPSDIVAGFVLLRHMQKAKEQEMVVLGLGLDGTLRTSVNQGPSRTSQQEGLSTTRRLSGTLDLAPVNEGGEDIFASSMRRPAYNTVRTEMDATSAGAKRRLRLQSG